MPQSVTDPVPPPVFAACIGLDRSDRTVDICLQVPGTAPQYAVLDNSPEKILPWLDTLRQSYEGQSLALCLEEPAGGLLHLLAGHDFLQIYAINPVTLSKYRDAFTISQAKNDASDAYFLMELARDHRQKLTLWKPDEVVTRTLEGLVEARRQAVDLRTQLTNQLQANLKLYFPQALELAGHELHTVLACNFLTHWPTLQQLKRAKPGTVKKFYHAHNSRRIDTINARLELLSTSVPLSDDAALLITAPLKTRFLVGQLRPLAVAIKEYERQIATSLAQHPDAFIFESLPGAAALSSARLIAAMGSDRTRYKTAQDVQNYSGISPVLKKSGNTRLVQRRYARPKFVHQTFVEYAGQSIPHCAWAKAYYDQQCGRGHSHFMAVRALAFKWQRIIFRCWQERVAYNEVTYLAALQRRHSTLLNREAA